MTQYLKALIFDLDGMLVDSSEVIHKVVEEWCIRNKVPLQSVLDGYLGGRTEDTVAWMRRR
jgi:beta-phosphoglucomutase-like phosphatase (HAD superfamily)